MARSPRGSAEGGAAALIMVAFLVIMMTLAAYVIDLGLARQIRREAQNAADAAALAGAGALWDDATGTVDFAASVAAVKDYAARNFDTADAAWASCSAPVPSGFTSSPSGTTCITYDSASTPTRVHVVLPTRVAPTLFGAAAGVTDIAVTASAEAALTDAERPICALCVEDEIAIDDGRITVTGGGSVNAGSVSGTDGGEVRVDDGGSTLLRAPPSGDVDFDPAPTVDPSLPARDPYVAAALPPIPADGALPATPDEAARSAGVTCGGTGADVASLAPGVWGDVSVTSGTCGLAPGLYVITGTVRVSGGTTVLAGAGVTLYFVCGDVAAPVGCSPGEPGGALEVDNGAALSIASPAGYPWAVVYDRDSTAPLALAAVDSAGVVGSIYAANGVLVLNSGEDFLVDNGSVVVRGLVETGDSSRLEIRDEDLPTVFRQPDIALDQLSS